MHAVNDSIGKKLFSPSLPADMNAKHLGAKW